MVFVPTPPHQVRRFESPWFAATRYGIDVGAAAAAAFLVSPLVAAIDRAIVENTCGRSTMAKSLKESAKTLAVAPLQFFKHKAFLWTWALYGTTYVVANAIDTSCEWASHPAKWPKFLGTTPVNMALVIRKDVAFANLFGTRPPTSLPLPSYGLFAVRDAHTIGAAFLVPPLLTRWFVDNEVISTRPRAEVASQLLAPAMVQFLSTPYHLLALDLYNRPGARWQDRLELIRDK
jgi:hypothetical protein